MKMDKIMNLWLCSLKYNAKFPKKKIVDTIIPERPIAISEKQSASNGNIIFKIKFTPPFFIL